MSLLNRREALILGSAAAAYGLAPRVIKAKTAIADVNEWAKIAAQQFMNLGVELVKNENNKDAPHPGSVLNVGLIQRHVDWMDIIHGNKPIKPDFQVVSRALAALTENVAISIRPSNRLKTFSLFVPESHVANAKGLTYGHLRLRFLQQYYPGADDGFREEGILNRIDILFPSQGV
jgi:hypothetical protein